MNAQSALAASSETKPKRWPGEQATGAARIVHAQADRVGAT